MIGLRGYLAGATLAACLGVAGLVWWQASRIGALRAEAQALRATVAGMEMQIDQAREARAVADARARAAEARAKDYDRLREEVLRDATDADLPEWMRDALDRLRSGRAPVGGR